MKKKLEGQKKAQEILVAKTDEKADAQAANLKQKEKMRLTAQTSAATVQALPTDVPLSADAKTQLMVRIKDVEAQATNEAKSQEAGEMPSFNSLVSGGLSGTHAINRIVAMLQSLLTGKIIESMQLANQTSIKNQSMMQSVNAMATSVSMLTQLGQAYQKMGDQMQQVEQDNREAAAYGAASLTSMMSVGTSIGSGLMHVASLNPTGDLFHKTNAKTNNLAKELKETSIDPQSDTIESVAQNVVTKKNSLDAADKEVKKAETELKTAKTEAKELGWNIRKSPQVKAAKAKLRNAKELQELRYEECTYAVTKQENFAKFVTKETGDKFQASIDAKAKQIGGQEIATAKKTMDTAKKAMDKAKTDMDAKQAALY